MLRKVNKVTQKHAVGDLILHEITSTKISREDGDQPTKIQKLHIKIVILNIRTS